MFYSNFDMTKFSTRKINDNYTLYSEGVKKKFEGYELDSEHYIVNKSDKLLDLQEITFLLLSKDLD